MAFGMLLSTSMAAPNQVRYTALLTLCLLRGYGLNGTLQKDELQSWP